MTRNMTQILKNSDKQTEKRKKMRVQISQSAPLSESLYIAFFVVYSVFLYVLISLKINRFIAKE